MCLLKFHVEPAETEFDILGFHIHSFVFNLSKKVFINFAFAIFLLQN